jgi:hypothetical protein
VIVLAGCADAVYSVEVGATADDDLLLERLPGEELPRRPRPVELAPEGISSLLRDVDAAGATVVVLVARRPPLLVSYDRGSTWSERGAGLPAGRAVALGESSDDVLYAGRNRLYLSRDGGVFWRSLGVDLPEILDVAWG